MASHEKSDNHDVKPKSALDKLKERRAGLSNRWRRAMNESSMGVCDICGAPATSLARDIARCEGPESRFQEYKALPGLKRGCDQHPAVSVEHDHRLLLRSTRAARPCQVSRSGRFRALGEK